MDTISSPGVDGQPSFDSTTLRIAESICALIRFHRHHNLPGGIKVNIGFSIGPGETKNAEWEIFTARDYVAQMLLHAEKRRRSDGDDRLYSGFEVPIFDWESNKSALIIGSTATLEFASRDAAEEHKATIDLYLSSIGMTPFTRLRWWVEPKYDADDITKAACETWFAGVLTAPTCLADLGSIKTMLPPEWFGGRKQIWMKFSRGDFYELNISEDAGALSIMGALLTPISFEEMRRRAEEASVRWRAAGGKPALFMRLGRRRDRPNGNVRMEWAVTGVLPKGQVSMLAGAASAGKSTIATELAVAAASDGPASWLGQSIKNCGGVVAILAGEDPEGVFNARLAALDPEDDSRRMLPYHMDGRSLAELCAELTTTPDLSLVVVDPARKYFAGDEDSSDAVSAFFGTLEGLAKHTGAAILVLHHLGKNAHPASLAGVREAIRGSAVWTDRPRVVLGIFHRQGVTTFGVVKHNIPPAYPMIAPMKLRRDPATLRHVPIIDTADISGPATGEDDDLERAVLAAIVRITADGGRVRRRGNDELWRHRAPEIDGIGRDPIRRATDRLARDGLLADGDDGLKPVD